MNWALSRIETFSVADEGLDEGVILGHRSMPGWQNPFKKRNQPPVRP